VALYGKNLGNVAYYTTAAPQPLGGLVSGGGTAAAQGFVGWYGDPRTYGIEFSLKY
jgi:outer membrane receptor protein involved in Fe transport